MTTVVVATSVRFMRLSQFEREHKGILFQIIGSYRDDRATTRSRIYDDRVWRGDKDDGDLEADDNEVNLLWRNRIRLEPVLRYNERKTEKEGSK
ncbi:hypothetical protein RIF29_28634 [Crotalaria pallida]|uniref:Uncharacterized protein n=1 Tax=Crotalaria pallida TaxID=3830 RepID=A0AAN9EJQ4_CROPI